MIFSGLLLVTGVSKAMRPHDTASAVRQLGLPATSLLIRLLAVGEIGVGVWVVATMSTVSLAAQSLLYGVFAVWTWAAIRSDTPLATCGCLGRPDTPPYGGHLAINVIGVVVSFSAMFTVGDALSDQPLGVVAALVVVSAGVWLAWSIMGDGARVAELTRP